MLVVTDAAGPNTGSGKLSRALLRFAQQKALGALAVAERDILAALGYWPAQTTSLRRERASPFQSARLRVIGQPNRNLGWLI